MQTASGALLAPRGVHALASSHSTLVYNFVVQDFHTYFVGQNHVWVHNGFLDCYKWAVNSGKTWGHTFSDHGLAKLQHLKDYIRSGHSTVEGVWRNDEAAAEFLKPIIVEMAEAGEMEKVVSIPEGLGWILKKDGEEIVTTEASHARIRMNNTNGGFMKSGKGTLLASAHPYIVP